MDAGTSEEKHAIFGKYKGRINNYLSKAGYDMKQAEKNLAEKQKPHRRVASARLYESNRNNSNSADLQWLPIQRQLFVLVSF